MKTYTERSNCIRAARKALGSQAQVDVDFRVYTVPLEVDGAETSVQRFAWEAVEQAQPEQPAEQQVEAQPEQEHRAERHGVMATIADLVRNRTADTAITKDEVHASLCSRFPDRNPDKMYETVLAAIPTMIRKFHGVDVRKVGRKPTRYFGA